MEFLPRQTKSFSRIRLLGFGLLLLLAACGKPEPPPRAARMSLTDTLSHWSRPPAFRIPVTKPVTIRKYFPWMDSLVEATDSLLPYELSEHLLVQANPWIIDTLAGYEYEMMIARDSFVYDQRDLWALRPGDTLDVPSPEHAGALTRAFESTVIEVNIPEYVLRILRGPDTLYTFSVRVGRYSSQFLELAGRTVDLRTAVGEGEMVRIERNPIFINPCSGERFTHTRRDDGRTTVMPLIPWMEPEIGGARPGHLIHPTTNPVTLGKAYSHGCVGTRESAAWYIYYHAPVGTAVNYRYDLEVLKPNGDTLFLKDIYELR